MMANWQEWTVALLVALCLWWAGRRFVAFFKKTGKGKNPCEGCTSNCKLKHLHDEPCSCHRPDRQRKKKNCCG